MSDSESYAIRIHRQAAADMDEAHNRMAIFSGTLYADTWQNGLRDVLASLAVNPSRYPLAHEQRLFRSAVRVYPYRFRPGNVIYRILYEIVAEELESPYVHILHIRHAARKPMTRTEARKIEDE